jgi:hypothetical protein
MVDSNGCVLPRAHHDQPFPLLRRLASKVNVGDGQYRNAVASVRRGPSILMNIACPPRTDAIALRLTVSKSPLLTFEAKPFINRFTSHSSNEKVAGV